MRRTCLKAFAACLALLALAALALPPEAPAQGAAPFTVKRLLLTTAVDSREPVDSVTAFPASAEKAWVFLEAGDVAGDTQIHFVWSWQGKEMLRTSLPIGAGARWRTWAEKSLRGLTGDWKVDLLGANGDLVQSVPFRVE